MRVLQYFQKKIKFIFCPWKHKKRSSKVAHNRPQTFFSQVRPSCPNPPRIDFSYYEYVPRFICLLICESNYNYCFTSWLRTPQLNNSLFVCMTLCSFFCPTKKCSKIEFIKTFKIAYNLCIFSVYYLWKSQKGSQNTYTHYSCGYENCCMYYTPRVLIRY